MKEHISVDWPRTPQRIGAFDHNFRRCVGSGRFDLALQTPYMEALRICQNEIGFQMIRSHGILSDQAGAYQVRKIPAATDVPKMNPPLHNFTRICRVIDSWLSVGIEPFIELGFMPADLASGSDTAFWWKTNVTPPSDYGRWKALVSDLIETLIQRYGVASVRGWNFEIWNEPDNEFWMPTGEKWPAYFELYRQTVDAVKSVDPELRVGGPATCPVSPGWVQDLVDECVAHDVPIDFASTHLYMIGGKKSIQGEFFSGALHPPANRLAQAKTIRGYLEQSQRSGLPLHITEWNTSWAPLDLMHETTMNAAYVAWIIAHVDDMFDSYSYWTFCDVFEECGVSSAPFHGGFGLVTEDGIRKPTFFAFQFASELGADVVYRSDTAFVTTREDGAIVALLYNLCLNENDQEPVEIMTDVAVPWPDALATIREVSDEVGTAYTTWKALGRPRIPSGPEMETIARAQWPRQTVLAIRPDEGRLCVSTTVPANGIALVEIRERQDESATYRDLPDREWTVSLPV